MQPIILLGVAVAAVALVGTGFLNVTEGNEWNQFVLWVQELGWGEAALVSPISHAFVDLEIKKIVNPGPDGQLGNGDDFFDNVIQSCSFHADKDLLAPPTPISGELDVTVISEGVIICKILNEDSNAIAEGKITIVDLGGYTSSDKEFIPIQQCITDEGVVQTTDGSPANCLDVQAEIHFVKLVVENALWEETELND